VEEDEGGRKREDDRLVYVVWNEGSGTLNTPTWGEGHESVVLHINGIHDTSIDTFGSFAVPFGGFFFIFLFFYSPLFDRSFFVYFVVPFSLQLVIQVFVVWGTERKGRRRSFDA
jgi:hypothetical protein